MQAQLVSIIMPVYNGGQYLSRAIESVLSQTYVNLEFLIIDDCSTDDSLEVIKSYSDSRIKLTVNDYNLGSLLSRNKLFKKASGKYIAFQDADDLSDKNKIQQQVSFLEENNHIHACGTFFKVIDKNEDVKSKGEKPLDSNRISALFPTSIPIVFASMMLRKSVYEDIGGFREYFKDKGNYDYDWMARIAEKYACSNIPKYLYYRRILSQSNSKNIVNIDKLFGDKTVQFLIQQRKVNDRDAFSGGDQKAFDIFVEEQRALHIENPELRHETDMHMYISNGMYKEAIKEALFAYFNKPSKLKYLKDVMYILKSSFKPKKQL
jgi:glycosyltransferase involved in cell wall biosynthesis